MQDWIVGLIKAASSSGPTPAAGELDAVATELGTAAPPELRSLYAQLNGASFPSGVTLWPLRGPESIAEHSRQRLQGFDGGGVWRLGTRAGKGQLFAAPKRAIPQRALETPPTFWGQLGDDAFVFGVKNDDTGDLKLYRSLEQMLSVMVPPVETEEFGERTYARAMSLVQGALDTLKQGAERAVSEVNGEVVAELASKARKGIKKVTDRFKQVRAGRKAKARTSRSAPAKKKGKAAAKKSAAKRSAPSKRKKKAKAPAKKAPRRAPARKKR